MEQLENIKLYNGDCLEYMKTIHDKYFELAIVDPPYGINFSKSHTGKGWIVRESKEWDLSIPSKEYFEELFRVSKNQIIWGGNYMVQYLTPSMGWIFWDKGQRNFSLADGELAYTSFNKALRVYTYSRGKHQATRGGVASNRKANSLIQMALEKLRETRRQNIRYSLWKFKYRYCVPRLRF